MKAAWNTRLIRGIFSTFQYELLAFIKSTQPLLTLSGIRTAIVQSISLLGGQHTRTIFASQKQEVRHILMTRHTRQETATRERCWRKLPVSYPSAPRTQIVTQMGVSVRYSLSNLTEDGRNIRNGESWETTLLYREVEPLGFGIYPSTDSCKLASHQRGEKGIKIYH